MYPLKQIVLATDFSPSAEHAFRYALALANHGRGTLHFVHILEGAREQTPGMTGQPAAATVQKRVADRLEAMSKEAAALNLNSDTHIRQGKPWKEIIALAEEVEAELILVGSHGHSGFEQLVFGGTCEKVVRLSPVPVLTIKDPQHEFVDASAAVHLKRVLFPSDYSEYSKKALPMATALCREFGATLVLAHVMYPYFEFPIYSIEHIMPPLSHPEHPAREALSELAAELEGVTTEVQLLEGVAHRELKALIEDTSVDLVVMATHGHTGVAHLLLGSVADKILRTAPCPVMTLRPEGMEG